MYQKIRPARTMTLTAARIHPNTCTAVLDAVHIYTSPKSTPGAAKKRTIKNTTAENGHDALKNASERAQPKIGLRVIGIG
jgi:hypothetical protein